MMSPSAFAGVTTSKLMAILVAAMAPALFFSSRAEPSPEPPLHVMTFNLRYNNPGDGINAWPNRKTLAAAAIRENKVDLVGVQEALASQLADLHGLLPAFGHVGVGRDDGKERGEHSAILYNRERFTVLKSGTFWLSETPETPGRLGWDAACPRIATWGIFEERGSKRRFFFLNTHLDHRGERSQLEGARLIAQRIAALKENLPVILTGDFNCAENSPAVQLLLADKPLGLRLARENRTEADLGGRTTFNGFKPVETGKVIDFIFVSEGIKVTDYRYVHVRQGDVLVSDHWPVVSTVQLPPSP